MQFTTKYLHSRQRHNNGKLYLFSMYNNNLESVLFSDQSCVQEILEASFFLNSGSLQFMMIIPKSVIKKGDYAFEVCWRLKSVIVAEHSSTQKDLNVQTIYERMSPHFISIRSNQDRAKFLDAALLYRFFTYLNNKKLPILAMYYY